MWRSCPIQINSSAWQWLCYQQVAGGELTAAKPRSSSSRIAPAARARRTWKVTRTRRAFRLVILTGLATFSHSHITGLRRQPTTSISSIFATHKGSLPHPLTSCTVSRCRQVSLAALRVALCEHLPFPSRATKQHHTSNHNTPSARLEHARPSSLAYFIRSALRTRRPGAHTPRTSWRAVGKTARLHARTQPTTQRQTQQHPILLLSHHSSPTRRAHPL